MRVLIDYRPALRQRTGVGEYAHRIATALVPLLGRAGGGLTLFSSSWKHRLASPPVEGARVVDARIPVRVLNRLWHRWEWPPVEWLSGEMDVVHAMHPLLIPARSAAQIVTIHDLYFLDRPESTAAEVRRDYPVLAATHARRADAVIVVSEYTAAQVESRFEIPRERITICPSGAPDWSVRRSSSALGPLLFVGTIEARKNVGTLLDAYERLLHDDSGVPPLVLAGGASTESSTLLQRLTRAPLAGRAQHRGYVTDAERQRLYSEASVLVLPSLDEGFGIPALEAMSVGLPVVAANRGALPQLLDGAGLLVEPDDVAGIAAAVRRVLHEPGLAAACAERGLARAEQFTWTASAERLLQAYAAARDRRAARR